MSITHCLGQALGKAVGTVNLKGTLNPDCSLPFLLEAGPGHQGQGHARVKGRDFLNHPVHLLTSTPGTGGQAWATQRHPLVLHSLHLASVPLTQEGIWLPELE